jgi:hypothetical protein
MTAHSVNIAGIEIPSSDPVFLAVVAVRGLLGLTCTITGIIAMLSVNRNPRARFGGNGSTRCSNGFFAWYFTPRSHQLSARPD